MRWDSPIVLVAAGTAAIHTILLVFVDAMIVTHPLELKPPAPHVEMFEVKVEPPPKLEPAVAPVQARTEPPVKQPPTRQVQRTQPREAIRQPTPPTPPPPTDVPPSPDSGGGPVVNMPDLAPDARGTVPVLAGGPRTNRVGRGGTGTGTGAGSGAGSADAPPPPVSVATIKTRALPKGDYGYIDASRDYPVEARQLGIEGAIRVRLIVDATGKVVTAALLNKLGHGLDELALDRAKKIVFDPAKDTDDKPVTSVVVWTFNMTLPKN